MPGLLRLRGALAARMPKTRPSRSEATIHSLFCFFPFAVLWLDAEQRLVDCRLVRPWALVVAPKCAAASFVEGAPELLDRVRAGDRIVLEDGQGPR